MSTKKATISAPEPLVIRRDGTLVHMPQLTQAQKDALWAMIVTYWARNHPETLRALAEGMEEEP